MGLDLKPLKLRLIRIDLPTGETQILITSLIDKDLYPYDIFAELSQVEHDCLTFLGNSAILFGVHEKLAGVVQLVERFLAKEKVVGSTPIARFHKQKVVIIS